MSITHIVDSIRMGLEIGILAALISHIGATTGIVWWCLAGLIVLTVASLVWGMLGYVAMGLRKAADLVDRHLVDNS